MVMVAAPDVTSQKPRNVHAPVYTTPEEAAASGYATDAAVTLRPRTRER